MGTTHKRKRKTGTGSDCNLDFISDLPGHIIDCILSRLPLREAVRTSILSPKWRVRWVKLQHLDFSYQFYRTTKEALKNKGRKYNIDYELKYEYERIINKIFFNHLGTIVKVILYIPKFDGGIQQIPDTDQWIPQLSRNNIKELTLNYEERGLYLLPNCFFSCLDLTHLELRNLFFPTPRDFKGFRNLIAVKFRRVSFMDDVFESLISGSPLLQKLIFADCDGISHFTVSAPNLESLQLHDNCQLKTICLENVPKLSDVTISTLDTRVDHSKKTSPLWEFLTSLPKVTRLSLNGNFLKYLAADSLPQELPTTIEGLKYLKLNNLDFANFDEISCALCLIRNSPNLKEIEIQASTTRLTPPPPKWGYMAPEAPFWCTLDRLRVVKIELIAGLRPELELIQFLLANSPVLEKMYINAEYTEVETKVALDMAIKLIRYYRASPRVDFRYLTLRDI